MKLKKLLEINAMCEEQNLPWDVREPFDYDSDSLGLTDINEMDIVHFIRAFKVLANPYKPNTDAVNQSKVALNLISGKLHIAVNELEEYINNE